MTHYLISAQALESRLSYVLSARKQLWPSSFLRRSTLRIAEIRLSQYNSIALVGKIFAEDRRAMNKVFLRQSTEHVDTFDLERYFLRAASSNLAKVHRSTRPLKTCHGLA